MFKTFTKLTPPIKTFKNHKNKFTVKVYSLQIFFAKQQQEVLNIQKSIYIFINLTTNFRKLFSILKIQQTIENIYWLLWLKTVKDTKKTNDRNIFS